MLAAHPLAVTVVVTFGLLWVGGLLVPAHAHAQSLASTVVGAIPLVGPIVNGVTGVAGGAGGLVTGGVGAVVGGVANDIFVKGFGALLQFIFGNTLTQLAQSFLTDLLDVTPLSGPKAPAGLGQLHSAIDGAGWGLLTLSFTAAALGYWLSSYTSSGAQQAATAFARTVGAIGLLISSPYIFYAATEAVNQLTHAIITTPVVSGGMTQVSTASSAVIVIFTRMSARAITAATSETGNAPCGLQRGGCAASTPGSGTIGMFRWRRWRSVANMNNSPVGGV